MRVGVRLFPSNAGGRAGPIRTGYRSLLRFDDDDAEFGFELELDCGVLGPGEHGAGTISLWAVGDLPYLMEGLGFEIREGVRVVGYGTIVSVDQA